MKCRCCNSQNLKFILDLGDQAWGNDFIPISAGKRSEIFPLQVYMCSECQMLQLNYTVPKEKMFVDHAYLSGTTKSLKEHFISVGEEIFKRCSLSKISKVLDIGGNDGTFLEFFHQKGLSVLNVDSGKLQAEKSKEKGIACENVFFNETTAKEIKERLGTYDVLHGSGILFHLEELHSAFKGIKTLLSDKGFLVAEFIYLPDMVKNCAYDQIYHEHLLYYSLHSFGNLLKQFDLEFVDAFLKPIHGGSCIAFISHKGAHTKTESLNRLMQKEREEGFDKERVYLEFAERVKKTTKDLHESLVALKNQGKRIQALGAPVKGSTLLNSSRIDETLIECAVEINPYKCNTYYPGTRIPVYHQDEVKAPDVYLLLSWNFKDEILKKLKGFKENGGKVLIPIPTPHLE